ncbi:TRAP transporter small permease [Halorientalis marina]|jgi:TRAP-type C4-dicarboxylate transport system permease small subunit|uniref:TRAP transporter small permease n=1 Tax=Halorientalis marina TaxID=2931976 RepID=UPI001FF48819|nr:TRAP transporter small permease subunit [Halorientalis marina]
MSEAQSDLGRESPSKRNRWRSKLEKNFEGYLALILLIAYTAIIIYDITNRLLFGEQLLWGLTTILGLFSWVCWLSASMAIRSQSHFRFTLGRQKVSNKMNYLLYWVDTILWVVVIGSVAYFSINVLMGRVSTGVVISGTNFPRYLMYASVPVGTILMMVRAIQQIVHVTKEYKNDENITPDSSI